MPEGIVAPVVAEPVVPVTPVEPVKPVEPSNPGNPNPATKPGEDARTKGILADLQKERKARQEYEARLQERDRQIAALTNSRTPSPAEASDDEIRKEFVRLYPELGGITKEDIQAIRELRGQAESMRETTDHYWTNHGQVMLEAVETAAVDALGGELSASQKRRLASAYIAEAQNDPEFLDRHNRGDKKLVAEFVKSYLDDFYEPGKRSALANEVNRNRPVPRSGDRNVAPGTPPKKIDVNDTKAVEDVLVEGFKQRGGIFGRRQR